MAKIIGSFSAKLKAEGAQYTALLTQQTAASELQAVGYFADTADTLTAINKSIVSSLEAEKTTLVQEQDALKAKLASAPAALKAGLQAQITAIGGKITSLTQSISSAMGTVEQDLASAVSAAQSQFQSAVANLQTDLDNQLQANAMNASGATGDAATLAGMQAADQLKGLTDSVAAAQKALDADTAAGSQATADQISQDQASLAAAKRSLDEYNLSIKVQNESATATAAATKQTNDLNTALAGYEADLLSGKITAAQFQADLDKLRVQFGVNIDTTGAEFLAVASSARAVEGAFDALISWINSQTGSHIPQVGGGSSGPATTGTVGPGPPDSPGRGGTGIGTVGTPQNLGVVGLGAAGYAGNIHVPGLQMAAGGIVPMLHAMSGMVVPGMPHGADYVPAMLNGGEMILNAGQQMNLWKTINSPSAGSRGRGGGDTYNFHFPHFVGDKREMVNHVPAGAAADRDQEPHLTVRDPVEHAIGPGVEDSEPWPTPQVASTGRSPTLACAAMNERASVAAHRADAILAQPIPCPASSVYGTSAFTPRARSTDRESS